MARTIAHDHGEKRAHILRVAAKTFAREGYDRASMARVAADAGISKANIYHYYDSKDDLLFALLDGYLLALRERFCGLKSSGDAAADLRAALTELLLAYQGADDEHRVQAGALTYLPEEQQKILRAYQRGMVDHMAGLLRAAAPDVFAEAPEKLRPATMAVFGMLNWFYMWNAGAGEVERRDYAALVCDLCLRGLPGLNDQPS